MVDDLVRLIEIGIIGIADIKNADIKTEVQAKLDSQ